MCRIVTRISLFSIAVSLLLFPTAIGFAQENIKTTLATIASCQNHYGAEITGLKAEIRSLKDALKDLERERKSDKQIIEYMKDAENSSLSLMRLILVWTFGIFTALGVVVSSLAFVWARIGLRDLKTVKDNL
jgi:hypothetical protein